MGDSWPCTRRAVEKLEHGETFIELPQARREGKRTIHHGVERSFVTLITQERPCHGTGNVTKAGIRIELIEELM